MKNEPVVECQAVGVQRVGVQRGVAEAKPQDRICVMLGLLCKRRGFCPSCGGRCMADTAAHLVDRVLPEVLIRQWVLTLPYQL